jgi:hypothetical protein
MSALTVEEMAERLGIKRASFTGWHNWSDATGVVVEPASPGVWFSWPVGRSTAGREEHPTELDAMLRLYRLRFPEAPAAAPASKKRTNVEIVEAAWEKWEATPTRPKHIDHATECKFAAMLAEAFVQDEVDRG